MEHLSGLLRGLLEHPHEGERRLILADYLEEHGEGERAEWIRCNERILAERDRGGTFSERWDKHHPLFQRVFDIQPLPLPPLPRPADAPSLAEVLRAWCGVWPHEDDSLREFVCWWLAAVEWDHERAGKIAAYTVREFDNGGVSFWYVYCPSVSDLNPDIGQVETNLTPSRAVRDLKRRVLGLFPEVHDTKEVYISEAEYAKRRRFSLPEVLGQAGFDLRQSWAQWHEKEQRRWRFEQTLSANQWIAPESRNDHVAVRITSETMQHVRLAARSRPQEVVYPATVERFNRQLQWEAEETCWVIATQSLRARAARRGVAGVRFYARWVDLGIDGVNTYEAAVPEPNDLHLISTGVTDVRGHI